LCSFSLSYLIVEGFSFSRIDFFQYSVYTFVFCLVALPVIYFGRLHTGLLRFSNSVDLFRVFAATVTFSVIFLVLMVVFGGNVIAGEYDLLYLTLLVNFF